MLIEYRRAWGRDAIDSSGLSVAVKAHLAERGRALRPAKVLFVRRRGGPDHDGVRVFWGRSAERGSTLDGTVVERYDDLLELDFTARGTSAGHPVLLVCTHGKHDPCCARYGRPLYDAVRELVDDGWAWQTSHIGGDRFAGNLVCLPEGLYFGRVEPGDAWAVLEQYLAGRVYLDLYRGRSCYPFAVQAAELAVRERTGLVDVEDLELVSRSPIRFRAGGREYEVEVERRRGELAQLTCNAGRLSHPPRYAARILRESAA